MDNSGFVIFMVAMMVLQIPLTVFWIVYLIEVVRIPDEQYRAAGTEKVAWVLILALVGFVGAIVWIAVKRKDVKAAEGVLLAPPAGWYWQSDQAALRWWDGTRWTEYEHRPAPGVDVSPN